MNGRCIGMPQGRALGGSSAINAQTLVYPSPTGVNAWAELGNPGWDWSSMASYYRKFQTLNLPSDSVRKFIGVDYVDENVQGKSGPIQVSFPESEDQLAKAWVDTFQNLSFKLTSDPFGGKAAGGFSNPSSIDPNTRTRSYAASAYYAPAASRPNLHVMTEAFVERIILDGKDDGVCARGVEFVSQGESQKTTAKARKEVILAAGACQSPKILELSGVGNAELLQVHGVETHVDNSGVGENFQDHVFSGISFEVKDGIPTADDFRDPNVIGAAMQAYQSDRSGPFCRGGVGSYAYMPVVDFLSHDGKAELKQLLDSHLPETEGKSPAEKLHSDHVRSILESPDDTSTGLFMAALQANLDRGPSPRDIFGMALPGNYITLCASLLHPFSRGSVHINSSNPRQKPTIDPRYFSHPLDIEILARHMQYLEKIAETHPLAGFLKPGGRRNASNAYVKDLNAAKDFLRSNTVSNWHPSGTCPMMPKDIGGVVNERLIVHGTKNLRVVDSSIFPLQPR